MTYTPQTFENINDWTRTNDTATGIGMVSHPEYRLAHNKTPATRGKIKKNPQLTQEQDDHNLLLQMLRLSVEERICYILKDQQKPNDIRKKTLRDFANILTELGRGADTTSTTEYITNIAMPNGNIPILLKELNKQEIKETISDAVKNVFNKRHQIDPQTVLREVGMTPNAPEVISR